MLYATPQLDDQELSVLAEVEALRGRLRTQLHEPRRWVGSLRRQSFARAVQGSNSIEGFDAKLDDAAAIADGAEPIDAAGETREAIRGYSEAMTYVLQVAREKDFAYSPQLIKVLHFMMTSYNLDNRPGNWRAGDIYVRDDASGAIVYEGPPVDEVPTLMDEFTARLEAENGCAPTGREEPPLVRAAMAHLNLVMIHPFRDGNGRMARCLQSLIIAREGVLSPIFMNIEEYLGRNTPAYYKVLGAVGQGRYRPDGDARPWLRFALTAHLRQARTVLVRVRESARLWVELERLTKAEALPERALTALFDAALGQRIRNSTYRAWLKRGGDEEISLATASRDLSHLASIGLLEPQGVNRGRYYVAGATLRAVRQMIVAERDPRDDSDPFAGEA
ncbi:Fic family protein [Nonomuraea sp. NPDC049158]|uniref:Fic family protein n=1 Tax=Nonomuraea sp. NPDC049158 TaxID=3155649 RepID=UPI0034043A86